MNTQTRIICEDVQNRRLPFIIAPDIFKNNKKLCEAIKSYYYDQKPNIDDVFNSSIDGRTYNELLEDILNKVNWMDVTSYVLENTVSIQEWKEGVVL